MLSVVGKYNALTGARTSCVRQQMKTAQGQHCSESAQAVSYCVDARRPAAYVHDGHPDAVSRGLQTEQHKAGASSQFVPRRCKGSNRFIEVGFRVPS